MKKILLLVFVFGIGIAAQAQFIFGAKLGPSLANYFGDVDNNKMKLSFDAKRTTPPMW